jgi:putative copper resistance protein D
MIEALGVAVRTAQLLAASLLAGVFAALTLVARPAQQAAGLDAAGVPTALDRRLLALARWALSATVGCGLLDLWRQTAVAAGLGLVASLDATAIGTVLLQTQYGAVWLVRHGVLALLAGLLWVADTVHDERDWTAFRLQALGSGAASLALLGAAGHAAAAQIGPGLAIGTDAAHLLATGMWLGALAPLALILRWALELPEPAGVTAAASATRRFSIVGFAAVALLVVTGVVNTWAQVGSVASLVGTPYGRWLLLKLALFVPLLAVAAVNTRVLKPRLLAAAAAGSLGPGRPTIRRLRRNVVAEAVLGCAILGVAGLLGLTTPGRHETPSWPFEFRLSWEATRSLPGVQARVAIGSQLALFGLVAVGLALLIPTRRRPWIFAAGAGATALGLAVSLPPLAVDAYPTTYVRPTVPYAAGSIAGGQRLYAANCAVCHGEHGYGDGPAAAGLRPRPADLTAKHTADHTVGDMFWWLTHGIRRSAMPGFGERLSVEERWDLINFLRALAAAEQARRLGPTAEPKPSLVAPDFAYTRGVGESKSLKDYRGERLVVLVLFTLPDSGERLSRLSAAYERLLRAGAEVIGIPLGGERAIYRQLGSRLVLFPIAVDGAADAAAAYALFRPDPEAPPPPHLEVLIDRQGYGRARWSPGDGAGWTDPDRLVAEVERLAREPALAAAPDEHVH